MNNLYEENNNNKKTVQIENRAPPPLSWVRQSDDDILHIL